MTIAKSIMLIVIFGGYCSAACHSTYYYSSISYSSGPYYRYRPIYPVVSNVYFVPLYDTRPPYDYTASPEYREYRRNMAAEFRQTRLEVKAEFEGLLEKEKLDMLSKKEKTLIRFVRKYGYVRGKMMSDKWIQNHSVN